MNEDMKEYQREHQVPFQESLDSAKEWREIASQADLLYITQIPRDRFGDRVSDYERSKEIFRVTPEILKGLKRDTYILHPFPRDYELRPMWTGSPGGLFRHDQIQPASAHGAALLVLRALG
jgi:aspartate carbamoyltransferase catalytic subunit